MNVTLLWLSGFALTLAAEEAIAVPLLARAETSRMRRMFVVLIANLATHPLVWFFFARLGLSRTTFLWVAEIWAFGFELVAYRVLFQAATWRRCTLVSIAANSASLLLGFAAIEWGLYR